MRRADQRANAFSETYARIIVKLTETEFRGLFVAVADEALRRDGVTHAEFMQLDDEGTRRLRNAMVDRMVGENER